jgi:tetratricopeptide (TPR) repeat protein
MEKGVQALESEDYSAARDAFNEVIATAPSDPRGYIGLGQALAGLEQYQEALAAFTQAYGFTSSAAPQIVALRAEAQFQRGKMYMDMGSQFIGTALPDLQFAYDNNPDDLRYAYQLGKAYAIASPFNPGAGAQAEPLLDKYLEQYPDDAEALRLRGTAYASMNEVDKSLADLDRAMELAPDDYQTYLAAATVYMTQEDYQQAAALLEKSIDTYKPEEGEEDQPFAQGYLTLAAVYEEQGKALDDPEAQQAAYSNSVATCDKLLGQLPENDSTAATRAAAFFRKGIGHRLLEEFGPAVKALTDAIDINPEMGEAYFRRGICFVEMEEEGLAMSDFEDAQALLFGDARPHLWEGITFAQAGEYRDAIRAYNMAISFSNRYVDAYRNRAHAYFQLGEFDNAIESFNECIRLQPAAFNYYFERGLCFENLGKPDEAVQSYINAIQFNENFAAAYERLIPLLQRQNRGELADQYQAKRAEIAASQGGQ